MAIGFLPGLFWKTEYRFSEYSTDRLPLIIAATGQPQGFSLDSHKYVQTLQRAGLALQLGGPGGREVLSSTHYAQEATNFQELQQQCRGSFVMCARPLSWVTCL